MAYRPMFLNKTVFVKVPAAPAAVPPPSVPQKPEKQSDKHIDCNEVFAMCMRMYDPERRQYANHRCMISYTACLNRVWESVNHSQR